jgi:hypothetical protein
LIGRLKFVIARCRFITHCFGGNTVDTLVSKETDEALQTLIDDFDRELAQASEGIEEKAEEQKRETARKSDAERQQNALCTRKGWRMLLKYPLQRHVPSVSLHLTHIPPYSSHLSVRPPSRHVSSVILHLTYSHPTLLFAPFRPLAIHRQD